MTSTTSRTPESGSSVDPRFTDRAQQAGLDLLRAAAITMVVFYDGGNLGFSLPGEAQRFGWVGVDLFFVLSGYLIAGLFFAVERPFLLLRQRVTRWEGSERAPHPIS